MHTQNNAPGTALASLVVHQALGRPSGKHLCSLPSTAKSIHAHYLCSRAHAW